MDPSLIPSDDDEPSVSPPRTPPARPVRLTPHYPDSPAGTEADAKRLSKAKASLHRKLNAAKDKRVVKC